MDDRIDFTYADSDSYQNEIAEIYSYSEEEDINSNRYAFEDSMDDLGLPLAWKHMVDEQKLRAINYLMGNLDVTCRTTRLKACKALGYLVQGNFAECSNLEEQARDSIENVFLLYQHGLFQAFVQQLLIESFINESDISASTENPMILTSIVAFAKSSDLRLILSVLCTILETMNHARHFTEKNRLDIRKKFITDLQSPIGGELLPVTLFQILVHFWSGSVPHYPIRKLLILLWKVLLLTLGGTERLRDLKEAARKAANLDPSLDDVIEVVKNMQPCIPPLWVIDDPSMLGKTSVYSSTAATSAKRKVFKQLAFDDAVLAYANSEQSSTENDSNQLRDTSEVIDIDDKYLIEMIGIGKASDMLDDDPEYTGVFELRGDEVDAQETDIDASLNTENSSKPNSKSKLAACETNFRPKPETTNQYKGLPWTPKVRKTDLAQHLSILRQKFLGYTLLNDLEATIGLPDPIIEGVNVMKKHMYISLSEIQLEREQLIRKYPLTQKEVDLKYAEAPAEKLYSALLPKLPQYMITLLKILLAASTGSKQKTDRSDSITITSEVLFNYECQDYNILAEQNKDLNRHREIIVKAVSAILILLLKHFKVNHIYQFEYVSQHLMFANCIPLILKFLSQDLESYLTTTKSIVMRLEFPNSLIGGEKLDDYDYPPFSWRNMFSCINLVRVLNKVIKWKHSRIMMLVVFKSAPTLMKALNICQPMFQLYVLKLLKFQLKFLGRQWKKSNMKLMRAIYLKVRHRLTDDWAYSNDNEARPWDFQAEEFTLQENIGRFHQRRYQNILDPNHKSRSPASLSLSDSCIDEDYDFGVSDTVIINPQFESSYESWLESQVFRRRIDWDKLLND